MDLFIDFEATERMRAEGCEIGEIEEHIADFEKCGRLLQRVLVAIEQPNDESAFLAGLRGDRLEEAKQALYRAITDFFPQSRRRLFVAAVGGVAAEVDELVAKIESGQMSEDSAGELPESLESAIQAPTAFGS